MAPINVDDGDDGGDSSSADAEQAAAQLAAQQAAALLAAQQAAALLAAEQAAALLAAEQAAAQLAAEQAAALLAAEQAAALRAAEQAAAQRAAQRAAAIAAAIAADSAVVTICFQAGSTVTTDHGNIAIEKLNPKVHTIRGKKIVSITKSTPLQKIFYNGKMVNVIDLGEVFQGATENNGKIIYIVLLKSIRR